VGKILLLTFLLSFLSCGEDRVKIINNSNRVADLERRVTLLEQVVDTKVSTEDLLNSLVSVTQELNSIKDRLEIIESDYLTDEDYQDILDILQDRVDGIVSFPAIYVNNNTFITNNVNNTINHITQVSADLTDLLARLDALENNQQTSLDDLEAQLQAIQTRIDNLRSNCLNAHTNSCPY
jgi:chromosome segregation ATPase